MSVVGGPCPSRWSHVCAEQVFRLCVVPISPKGSASVLAAALPPRCPSCPGLVTAQKGARISSGNSESSGLPQDSDHTCAYYPPKPCPVRGDTGPFSF